MTPRPGRQPYRPGNMAGKPQPDQSMRLPGGGAVRVVSAVGDPNNGDYAPDELEFLKAMDWYRTRNRRPFPTLREYLAVLKSLGYRKQPPPTEA